MIRPLGSLAAALAAAAFLGLGAGSLAAPQALANTYGIPAGDAASIAFLRAVGMRDAVFGLAILALLLGGERRALAVTVGLTAAVGASDFAIVASARGRAAPQSLAIHAAGTLGLLAIASLLTKS